MKKLIHESIHQLYCPVFFFSVGMKNAIIKSIINKTPNSREFQPNESFQYSFTTKNKTINVAVIMSIAILSKIVSVDLFLSCECFIESVCFYLYEYDIHFSSKVNVCYSRSSTSFITVLIRYTFSPNNILNITKAIPVITQNTILIKL